MFQSFIVGEVEHLFEEVDPEDGLHRPVGTAVVRAVHGSKARSSSIRGSASFRKTSAQLLSRRLAFFGVTRNWDCQRLSCGSRIRNIPPSLGQAQRPRPFITLSPPCPRLARGFYEQINLGPDRLILGEPDECVAEFRRWSEAVGAEYFLLRLRHAHSGGPPHEKIMEAIRLFGAEVIPACG